jgi:HPr kinase/phosphorylase
MAEPVLTVAGLIERGAGPASLSLELLSGHGGVERRIASPYIQKTGLALAGFHEYLRPGRVVVFGESEVRYLESLPHHARLAVLDTTFSHDIPCVLITGGGQAHEDLQAASERHQLPVLRTAISTPVAISRISALLDDALAVREIIHGVLMDVLGLGVLIIGDSGIGKSECALDLIVRGHRLVADDTVQIRRRSDSVILGACPEPTRYHMELRGLGIINVRDLFGVAATRASKRVELVVQLERWDVQREYDRLGVDENVYELFGVRVPLMCMPVAPGRNLATLIEVAARNQLLRSRGLNAARDFVSRLEQQLQNEDIDLDSEEEPRSGEPQ